MIPGLPHVINVVFIILTLLTIGIFYKAGRSRTSFVILLFWISVQAVVSLSGFYLTEDSIPPRMALLAGPAILFIIGLFVTSRGRAFLDSLDLRTLTGLHSIRILVELELFWLYKHQAVPEMMTFAGVNFDIVAGLTAPLMVFLGFRNGQPRRGLLLGWNILCLLLLVNIVSVAVLSAPTPLQQFAFEQPAVALLYFPYTWLPCCVVPIVLLSHLAAIRKLTRIK